MQNSRTPFCKTSSSFKRDLDQGGRGEGGGAGEGAMASISATTYGEGVYPPSDDTFLLVDALEQDLAAFSSGVGNESAEAAAKKGKCSRRYGMPGGADVTFFVFIFSNFMKPGWYAGSTSVPSA